jgi:dipeptidyl aminopeptidase/acylaminoacyl peptidase
MKKINLFLSLLLLFSCHSLKQKVVKQYSAEQLIKSSRISGGVFSPDESKILISSNENGIFNLFEIIIETGNKVQITNSVKQSLFVEDYVPETNQIIYSADKEGNEISHLYKLDNDVIHDLTPGDNEKAIFSGWSKDKKSMYYLSNKRNPQFFDLYKMKTSDWSSVMIYQNNDGFDISGISKNEGLIALQKNITSSENKLFLFDRNSWKSVEISDPLFPGVYFSSGFSNDGQYFYFTTNAKREFTYLVQYDIISKQTRILYETNWDVVRSILSENEKFRVITINEDGRNSIILLDNSNGQRIEIPRIEDGNVLNVKISNSETHFLITAGTSRTPDNKYVYNTNNKTLIKLTETLNPEINPDDLVAAEVVRFKSFDGLEIPAIYYKPNIASKKNKVPALVFVHGGPGGQTKINYFPLIQYLVNHGYAVLAVNNRGSDGYGKTFFKLDDKNHGDKDLNDCIWGKRWLQIQDYIDSSKIGIIGSSYGGFITMAAMTFKPDEFRVGVNFYGVTNWLRTLKSIPPDWGSMRKAIYAELGDPFSNDSIRLHSISPLFFADRIKNPVIVFQGTNDPRVLKIESDEIVNAIRKNNVPVEYIIFPDEGHGFNKKGNMIKAYNDVVLFLDKYLKEIKNN